MPALRTRDTQSRSLEVTTDAPQPPVLNIVSPTPRAFTFPIMHNLSDSPYSSPSQSPFEPDLRSLPSVSQCTTPPVPAPSFIRTLTPESSFRSASPASSHKRRKSSCSSDIVERRPKKGDEDYIKRPENAFILFRRKCCEERHALMEEADGPTKKQRQADLSKTISQQWKSLPAEERKYWEDLAKEKKKEHEQMYPNYVYRPQRAKDKDGRSKSRKPAGKGRRDLEDTDSDSFSVVLPMANSRHHGRSASAPTPPPYTQIQVPTVYMTPSCPTSPSLLPMISRRSSHPGHPEEAMSNFDFVPSNNYLSPSYQAGPLEASLQSSDFLRSMWEMPSQSQRQELQPLDLPPPDESGLLPAHQIISPSSAVISPSSSVVSAMSSPQSSPYTPYTASQSHNYELPSADAGSPQSEHELQLEMQIQQDYTSYAWQNATNDMWATNSDVLLGDDFELSAIPPIELGMQKYNGDMGLGETNGLEFGQDFVQALEGSSFNEGGILNFDDMMAGQGFSS